MVEQIYPADQVNYNVTAYVRLSTPLFPLMDNQRIDTFFFFVPNRLVWSNWARFMGEQTKPGDSITYTIPTIAPLNSPGGFALSGMADHFGIPVQTQVDPAGIDLLVNVLPFRCYNLIYQEWFRDQNFGTTGIYLNTGDSGDAEINYPLRFRAKSHDYFTSALPWPQKFTAPTVPITGLAPVKGIGIQSSGGYNATPVNVKETATPGVVTYPFIRGTWDTTPNQHFIRSNDGISPAIYADLTAANASVTVNALRQAFAIQSLLERDARGGGRYIESNLAHFGVRSPDARLQRPEYIGGGQSPLNLTPIAQSAPTSGAPLGAIGAAGTSVGQHHASFAATEHGYIIGLINVRSEISYQQGLHKMWSVNTRYDFYYPALAGLGEQAILTKEIYYKGVYAQDNTVFGYQERWQELRTRTSEVTGYFRSGIGGTLDAWHLAQQFTGPPTLSDNFIVDNPPMARVLAAGALASGQQYLADILIQRSLTRALPTYGTPDTLGRF